MRAPLHVFETTGMASYEEEFGDSVGRTLLENHPFPTWGRGSLPARVALLGGGCLFSR
jgi:hypothetical protein